MSLTRTITPARNPIVPHRALFATGAPSCDLEPVRIQCADGAAGVPVAASVPFVPEPSPATMRRAWVPGSAAVWPVPAVAAAAWVPGCVPGAPGAPGCGGRAATAARREPSQCGTATVRTVALWHCDGCGPGSGLVRGGGRGGRGRCCWRDGLAGQLRLGSRAAGHARRIARRRGGASAPGYGWGGSGLGVGFGVRFGFGHGVSVVVALGQDVAFGLAAGTDRGVQGGRDVDRVT